MKLSTAKQKLNRVSEAHRQYQAMIIENPKDAKVLGKMARLRKYAERLILNYKFSPSAYRGIFYQKDLDRINEKLSSW